MMNGIRSIVFFGILALITINKVSAQKEIFLKEIEFELTRVSDIDYENEYFLTLKFTKGTKYVFNITSGINDRTGKAIIELLDADNLVLTNIFGDKYFELVNFQCNKTGFYDILVKFKDNELGHCRVDITMIQ